MVKNLLTVIGILTAAGTAFAAEDILIADFESETYGNWKVTGEAFGPGPAAGTLPGQMQVSHFLGKRLVNSFYNGDNSTGTLTSPSFKIQRRYINFLIGGGMYPGEACINLILNGKVVRTATGPNDRPGGSEALSWHNWDVSDLKGKSATIQIVDKRTGGWGHINIDHIVQSEQKIEPVDLTREIRLQDRYLHLPVKHGAPKQYVFISVDDETVLDFDIRLTADEPDYYAFIDTTPWKNETVTIRLADSFGKDPNLLAVITNDPKIKSTEPFYREKHRSQFHFSSRIGWNNDSNGMVYYKGEYHLFYQHNPYDWAWGNMTWGHAVSTDLVHWKELGDAIHPDHLGTIFSGSAVIDHDNTAGFQTGDEKPMVCFYTSAGGRNRASRGQPFTQSIAYSNDRGRTFTKYEDNPIIGHINGGNRDPKVIWHEPTSQWVMVLYLDNREMGFFVSEDLKNWEMTGKLKCFHECPELFELPVDGNPENTKWVLYGASGDYLLGSFDGREYTPETDPIRFQHGNCFYASQTFNNIPESDGRRIQIAWARVATPGMPFNQMMTFPVSLTLRTTDKGIRMFAEPVREINKLHAKKYAWKNTNIKPGENPLSAITGELFHITAELKPENATECGLRIRGVPIVYDAAGRQLKCKGKTASLEPENGRIRLEILVDRGIIEIFANDGRVYMPIGGLLTDNEKTLELFTTGGSTLLESLQVFELRSAWPNP